jgi:hypothetical protein
MSIDVVSIAGEDPVGMKGGVTARADKTTFQAFKYPILTIVELIPVNKQGNPDGLVGVSPTVSGDG